MNRKKLWDELNKIIGKNVTLDGLLSASMNKIIIDIFELDNTMDLIIDEYDSNKCTYKGKSDYSCAMVIKEHYGERAFEIINILMN